MLPLRNLTLRFALVGCALLLLGSHFTNAIVEPVVPTLGRALSVFTTDFDILSAELNGRSKRSDVVFRANLSHPELIGGNFIYPMGFGGLPSGGYQITLTSGGILEYPLFLFIIVLAWPASMRELAVRIVLAIPAALFLSLQHVVVTVLAELWFPFHDQLAPGEFWPLLAWSRFLMGGGGLAMTMAIAALIIALVVELQRRMSRRATVKAAASLQRNKYASSI